MRPLKLGGSTTTSFVVHLSNGERCTVKYMTNYPGQAAIYSAIKKAQNTTDYLAKIRCAFLSNTGYYCLVCDWFDGCDIDINKCNTDPEYLYNVANKAARALKQLHNLPIEGNVIVRTVEDEISRVANFINENSVNVYKIKDFLDAVDNISPIDISWLGYIHMDVNTHNFVYSDNAVGLIDFELVCVSDIRFDFSYALCVNHIYERRFWLCFLLSYFEGNIPENFFKSSRNFVITYVLKLLLFNHKMGTLDEYEYLLHQVYDEYDELKSNVPKWIIPCAVEVYNFCPRYKEAILNLFNILNVVM